eukprot:8833258-Pyramimonas_sp.AAC.1
MLARLLPRTQSARLALTAMYPAGGRRTPSTPSTSSPSVAARTTRCRSLPGDPGDPAASQQARASDSSSGTVPRG